VVVVVVHTQTQALVLLLAVLGAVEMAGIVQLAELPTQEAVAVVGVTGRATAQEEALG
jgi:hypothetical protein